MFRVSPGSLPTSPRDWWAEVYNVTGCIASGFGILLFNASVTFTTSSIAAVDTAAPFNVAFIVAIIGFVLFNCLYGAFAFIYRIVRPGVNPDTIIGAKRIAGIELSALACTWVLGTLSYTYGMACWPEAYQYELVASFVPLTLGIALIIRSANNDEGCRKKSKANDDGWASNQ